MGSIASVPCLSFFHRKNKTRALKINTRNFNLFNVNMNLMNFVSWRAGNPPRESRLGLHRKCKLSIEYVFWENKKKRFCCSRRSFHTSLNPILKVQAGFNVNNNVIEG